VPHAVFDVFAGAGGMSLGFAVAGFDVVAAAECDRDACATFAKAHPGATVFDGDVGVLPRRVLRSLRDDVDVVIGGPPCQPWSGGGKRLGAADPRNGWPAFLRVLAEVRPAAFVAENVAGLASAARRPYLDALLAQLGDLGFTTTTKVVDAAAHGVPQTRRRLFLVGRRDVRSPFTWPEPSTARRAARACVDAAPYGEPNRSVVTYARRPDLRPDPYHGHLFNGGGRPIDLARPAPTLLASMGGNKTPWVDTLGLVPAYHGHLVAGGAPRCGAVAGARRITLGEAARLQTFADDVQFVGSRASCYRQIGNAVPPRLACTVARALIAVLDRHA
jgi:DNA (cytosine-5)-methyltransferase 1